MLIRFVTLRDGFQIPLFILRNLMQGDLDGIVDQHKPETGVVSVALDDMLPRQIDLFDNVDEKVHHWSHEHAEVVNVIDDVWVLLDDVSKRFRINKRNRQFFVKRVVVPIHLCKAHDAGAGVVPAACARETPNEYRRWRRLERPFFVNFISGVFQIYAANAALRPKESLVAVDGKIRTPDNRETVRLRRPCWFESDAFPTDTLYNLDKLNLGTIAKTIESAKDFLLLEFGVLMDRDFLGK